MDSKSPIVFNKYVEVVVPGIPTPLLYGVGPDLEAQIGYQVLAPNRSRNSKGWVIRVLSEGEVREQFKDISVIKPLTSSIPAFAAEQLSFFNWISGYYAYPLAETIECALPLLEDKKRKKIKSKIVNRLSNTSPKDFELTKEQSAAKIKIEHAIKESLSKIFLLFGVTGSGKSEVYLKSIEAALNNDGGAIVLVPEIALTPQLIDYFELRLNQSIALLHSDITRAQKQETWEKILSGELKVVLGARSAIFAPIKNLKLIIVDEEHDSSFKQSDTLRYNARDLAIVRGKRENCTVILGSATPSFESLINVKKGNYELLELKERVNQRPLPEIELINLAKVKRSEMITPNISPDLYDALKPVIEKGEQAVILYNRRGFASYLQCTSCQSPVLCPNCSVTLTYHQSKEQLVCHYCGLAQTPPLKCPSCVNSRLTVVEETNSEFGELIRRGAGTERVVEELRSLFPDVTLVQMDRDTVTTKDSYREILGAMKSGKAQLLVGTQMVAKGHDIPGVTLVGIIDADVGLNSPDFRASERTLQLLTQVAGRAGRAERSGRVILQTRSSNHPSIVAATSGRFLGYAKFELDRRKALDYPPFGRLMRVIVSSTSLLDAQRGADFLGSKIMELLPQVADLISKKSSFKILGPAVAPHERLRGRFRYHLLVKSNSASALSALGRLIQKERTALKDFKDLRLVVDIDPVDML